MAAERVVRLALADVQRGVAEALAMRLDAEPDIAVVGVATGRSDLEALCDRHPPELVLLGADDLAPPAAPIPWLALVAGLDAARCVRLLRQGAVGVASTDAPLVDLLAGVRAVTSGQRWVPPSLVPAVIGLLLESPPAPSPDQRAVARLSDREREVLACLTRGLGQRAIAAELYVSPNTVRTHVRNVLVKLGARTSLEAAAVARRAAADTATRR